MRDGKAHASQNDRNSTRMPKPCSFRVSCPSVKNQDKVAAGVGRIFPKLSTVHRACEGKAQKVGFCRTLRICDN